MFELTEVSCIFLPPVGIVHTIFRDLLSGVACCNSIFDIYIFVKEWPIFHTSKWFVS